MDLIGNTSQQFHKLFCPDIPMALRISFAEFLQDAWGKEAFAQAMVAGEETKAMGELPQVDEEDEQRCRYREHVESLGGRDNMY